VTAIWQHRILDLWGKLWEFDVSRDFLGKLHFFGLN